MEWNSGIRWLFLFISLELLWPIMRRCPMWTASPRRRPLTLLTMTPPRVENWNWHHFHYEKFSLVKLVEISRPNPSACSRSHSKKEWYCFGLLCFESRLIVLVMPPILWIFWVFFGHWALSSLCLYNNTHKLCGDFFSMNSLIQKRLFSAWVWRESLSYVICILHNCCDV